MLKGVSGEPPAQAGVILPRFGSAQGKPGTHPGKGDKMAIIFPLILHQTYFDKGFFNVTVEFDHNVRRAEGAIPILVGEHPQQIEGRIDRSANNNKTPRIMGGAALRDWFGRNCKVGQTVYVDLSSMSEIRISNKSPLEK